MLLDVGFSSLGVVIYTLEAGVAVAEEVLKAVNTAARGFRDVRCMIDTDDDKGRTPRVVDISTCAVKTKDVPPSLS